MKYWSGNMHHVTWGASALDYQPCRYGQSRLLFRGPKKRLDTRYIAVLGGSRTYGKFVATPYSDLLEDTCGLRVINLGCLNAGLDALVSDESLISICLRSDMVVLEVQGITDLSNRFYTVHPRRNDRFVQASLMMERLFPEADFTEFNFTRHMLKALQKQWPDRVELVLSDLREAWVCRMERLCKMLPGKLMLLWLSDRPPPDHATGLDGMVPEGVHRAMLDAIHPYAVDIIEVVIGADVSDLATEGMHFLPHETEIAKAFPGPTAHRQVAEAWQSCVGMHLE